MKCPFCTDFDNKVVDSRLSGESDVIRRRRECLGCGRRFTTYERVEDILPMVIKKDDRREPFDRNKILSGIQTACQKRPVPVAVMEEIVERIEKSLQEKGDKEIKSSTIGETVMLELNDLDEVAYVRFASVYRSFKDINEFMDELKDMLEEEESRRMKEEKTRR
ncbi:MAG: transcriptional repressor NrdR [Zetaproteobacteria bacterium]|jgi:transcriptional repressor NrdR|nr:transcriptional repressor NrdR [Zetaproteobacteria bacterium]